LDDTYLKPWLNWMPRPQQQDKVKDRVKIDSLGINKSKQEEESNKSQELEDLTDHIKQKFIYDYKAYYSE
jgi:hypothetical protein